MERPAKIPRELYKIDRWPAWKSRGLTAASCRKWGVGITTLSNKTFEGQPVRVFDYRDAAGELVAQKVRPRAKKDMRFLNGDNKLLFGRHLWGSGGKKLVITEGELDAVSISQVQDHKWPVVSISGGASSAAKAIKENLEWISSFEKVVLWFDADGPGREAVEDCATLFKPGQMATASCAPFKDANEALQASRFKEMVSAVWQAKEWRPDGIVNGKDLWEIISTTDDGFAHSLPWAGLQAKTLGIRTGELWTICAGSGTGKSAVSRELISHLHASGETVGVLMLEEPIKRTALGLVGIHLDKPLHLVSDPSCIPGFQEAFNTSLGTGRIILYDHFGSTAMDNIIDRIRYMAAAMDCRYIFLDHLSILVSGMEDGDERRLIDNMMTRLASLAMEQNIGIIIVSHLKRPPGEAKGHEEGGKTSLGQLRGSHAIGQLSHIVVGLERDQQSKKKGDVTTLRVLKNRWAGHTGYAGKLKYDHNTGRLKELTEAEETFDDETEF